MKGEKIFPFHRAGGILLHPSSLPGKFGIGDLGQPTFQFIDFLHQHNQQLWQILPLGPTGFGDSPYQCFSAFAGNPYLISFEKIESLGILKKREYESNDPFKDRNVDYGRVISYKWLVLKRAFANYLKNPDTKLTDEFNSFKENNSLWLEDFALFMAIKKAYNDKNWITWPEPLRKHESSALNAWSESYSLEIQFHEFIQFLFFKQWGEIKYYAKQKNVFIIGDVPIYVAFDSSDVWANQNLFYLEESGKPIFVAGVPPDYFSETGQRWGNPLYRWYVLKKQNYTWWAERLIHALTQVDIIRIDHFRGFQAYWEIPAEEPTAINGRWVLGPGRDFFKEMEKQVQNPLPIIAEDLGLITPEVETLRRSCNFPGMRILQFAFGKENDVTNNYLPHKYDYNTVVYTGTHDNNTTIGWFASKNLKIKKWVLTYLRSTEKDILKDIIKAAWQSVAKIAIIPMQDLMALGSEARMNLPGKESGNWGWRFRWEDVKENYAKDLAHLSKIYERMNIE
jgi:4-alpha-glucanotransferase